MKKVVLAYSGGLDTSVICKWLAEKGFKVIAYVADVGQVEDFKKLKNKALTSGAQKVVVEDLRKEFVIDFVFKSIGFNATYEGRYLLGTSLARPLIAKGLTRLAKKEKAEIISHGATGKGNDQVRFELSVYALSPGIKVIAPWRMEEFYSLIKGRKEALEYAKRHNIQVKATAKKPWSSDDNLFHISFEAGMLEDPQAKPLAKMFSYTRGLSQAPNKVTSLKIEFKKGLPTKVNGQSMTPVELLIYLNKLGGENGVGRIDIVESRFLGMKSRGVYETPGGTILQIAHLDLECLTLSREIIRLKNSLMLRFSDLVYNGFWYSEEMNCLLAFLTESQKNVEGAVYLELYKGNVTVVGRSSKKSLYDDKVASMEDDGGAYSIEDATGFINLNALGLKAEQKDNRKDE